MGQRISFKIPRPVCDASTTPATNTAAPRQKVMGPAAERSQMWRDYLSALEEERRKIEVFGKELPLCLELVVQTIESYRRYLRDGEEEERRGMGFQLEMEEFLPITAPSASNDDRKKKSPANSHKEVASDWLKSAQLWNHHQQQQQHHHRRQSEHLKDMVTENKVVGNEGSGGEGGDGDGRGKEAQKSQRKPRRCWLPELHRSFLGALEQLGGSETATPKQIRELMNVEGLTNDEVKSHLQKYRLHTKRPRSPPSAGESSQADVIERSPHIMFGLWMPPTEYAAIAAATMASIPTNLDLHKKHKKLKRSRGAMEVNFPH